MGINIISSKKSWPQMGKDVLYTGKQLVSLIVTVLVKVAQCAFKFFSTMAKGMINSHGIKFVKPKSQMQVDTDQSREEQNSAGSKNVSNDGLGGQFRQSVASDDMDDKIADQLFNKHVMDGEDTAWGSRSSSPYAFEDDDAYFIPPKDDRAFE